jgi:hypothetical protein
MTRSDKRQELSLDAAEIEIPRSPLDKIKLPSFTSVFAPAGWDARHSTDYRTFKAVLDAQRSIKDLA